MLSYKAKKLRCMHATKKKKKKPQVKKSLETVLEEAQALNFLNKDFILAIINMFKELKKNTRKISYQVRNIKR